MADLEQYEIINDALMVRAPAKINLSLLIAGKRPDGFHNVETLIAKINWFDELLIEKSQKAGIELICKGPHWAPQAEHNLVYQAAKMVIERYGYDTGIKVTLTKNIPAASGLGSASSDAAAALLAADRFLSYGLVNRCKKAPQELTISQARLNEMAFQLGSDVAFFLNGPLAFCTGRGEKIKKLTEKFDFLAVLVLPGVSVSTKTVYNDYRNNMAVYERLSLPINGLLKKNRIDLVTRMCANMLESTCFDLYKGLAELKDRIESLGVGPLCLSGSGSAMFLIVDDRDEKKAVECQRKLKERIDCNSIIVRNNRW